MSNHLALAAVTATLKNLISFAEGNVMGILHIHPGVRITTKPVEKARDGENGDQVNISLYQTLVNPSRRNMPDPARGTWRDGLQPPLALDLYYIITTYSRNDDEIFSQELMGRVMEVMHQYPYLDPREIREALPDNNLYQQMEPLRISPQYYPLEEISKFWTSAGSGFRLSAIYKISVVLIGDARQMNSGLLSLQKPNIHNTPTTQPRLTKAVPPNKQKAALLGDTLKLEGLNLAGDDMRAVLTLGHSGEPFELQVRDANADSVLVDLPTDDRDLITGVFNVSLTFRDKSEPPLLQTTNDVSFVLAPQITAVLLDPPESFPRLLTLTCRPIPNPFQAVFLILGNRLYPLRPGASFRPSPDVNEAILQFDVSDVRPGAYVLRLRVSGIDSPIIDRAANPPRPLPLGSVEL